MKFRIASPPRSPVRKLLAWLVVIALLVPVLMFSAVILAIILIVGVIAIGIFWWKTRQIRKQWREFSPPAPVMDDTLGTGEIIEGEVIRVVRTRDER